MRKAKGRLAATDEANFVLDHAGQINVFLVAGYVAPGGFVGMSIPALTVAQLEESPRIGGVKDEQHYHFGTTDWSQVYGLRNTVESANANAKRSQFEDLGDPNKRSVPGNTFTYIVIVLALVAENLRQAISFFKRRLTLGKVTSKTTYAPDMYWQSNGNLPPPEVEPPLPR